MLAHPAHAIALGLGSGLPRVAPGTVGTLWGWAAFVLLQPWVSDAGWAWIIGLGTLVGWWACTVTARHMRIADSGHIVWDEIIAFWLVLWLITPTGFWGQLVAFALFRLFDAVKVGPMAWADRRFKGFGPQRRLRDLAGRFCGGLLHAAGDRCLEVLTPRAPPSASPPRGQRWRAGGAGPTAFWVEGPHAGQALARHVLHRRCFIPKHQHHLMGDRKHGLAPCVTLSPMQAPYDTQTTAILVEQLASRLRQHSLMMATAESCTGGLIAGACTDLSGSSDWFERGMVSYSNAAKTELLGVPAELINIQGAVSEPVARAMATGALTHSHAQCAVAVTGIAGPTGGSADKPVGTVWFAWATPQGVFSERQHFRGDRSTVRQATVVHALAGLLARLDVSDDPLAGKISTLSRFPPIEDAG